jgi:hypothetical protein
MRRCARQDSNLRPSVRTQPRSAPIDLRRAPRPAVKRIFLVRSEVQSAGTAANPPVVVVREIVNIGADSAIVQAGVRELGGTYFSSSTLFFPLMAPRHFTVQIPKIDPTRFAMRGQRLDSDRSIG